MILDEKVLTALEVLTDAAENDFELYRICTLVRDLVAPPKAEQVDDFHQKFEGVTYHKTKSGHYDATTSAHRVVWAYYNGEIPADYVIHHVDENPANNDISNLVLLTINEHQRIHCKKNTRYMAIKNQSREKVSFICAHCGREFKALDNGTNLYCSVSCRDAHRLEREGVKKKCQYCGIEFVGLKKDNRKYCSQRCGWLAKVKDDANKIPRTAYQEERQCQRCGKTFTAYKYDKTRYCSRECVLESHRDIRTCPVCGKEFTTQKVSPKKFCSRSCAGKYRSQNRKKD